MEQTLQDLAGILIKAIPTVILLIFLHLFLKAVLFGPVEKMLAERNELTKGARRTAAQSLDLAERKAEEYEAKLYAAKSEVYREQEEIRRKWLEDQAAQVADARKSAETTVKNAKDSIAAEAAAARATLERTADGLADQITNTVLGRAA
jgi:F-type H+-transporting ATPase subunit b